MTVSQDQLTKWRRQLHTIAEPAFTEHETSKYLATELLNLGLDVQTNIGNTGLVATLEKGSSGQSIGIRADIDGLPIQENTGLPYASKNNSAMHACGHDGHMAMALGAAANLVKENFDGIVRFIFQPAEEPGLGAKAMIEDGIFTKFPVDQIYGIHNLPGLPSGNLVTRSGPIMASEDNFVIRIVGLGGHASAPQRVIDPLVIAAQVITALQTIVSRSIDPLQSAVVSCTEIITDGARNAIPGEVTIKGDTRTFSNEISALVEKRMREIVLGICAANGASGSIDYTHEFEPTVNDAECAKLAYECAREVVGAERSSMECDPITASEDFGIFAKQVPGCFLFLGTGEDHTPLHNKNYDFNDSVLEIGVNFYTRLVKAKFGNN